MAHLLTGVRLVLALPLAFAFAQPDFLSTVSARVPEAVTSAGWSVAWTDVYGENMIHEIVKSLTDERTAKASPRPLELEVFHVRLDRNSPIAVTNLATGD